MSTRILTLALLAGAAGFANAEDYTFTGDPGGLWNVDTNWNPNGVPGEDDFATIPGDKACRIEDTDEEIHRLTIQAGSRPNNLLIVGDGSLTLNVSTGDGPLPTTIDGKLRLEPYALGGGSPKLRIATDTTINGSGHIWGGVLLGQFDPRIESDSNAYRLTLDDQVTLGGNVTIHTKFTNSATVHAGAAGLDDFETVTLENTSAPLGDGVWKVTGDDSWLVFRVEVTAVGALTGDFIINGNSNSLTEGGSFLDIRQNVTTYGHLHMTSGHIRVSDGKLFKAGYPNPGIG